MPPRARRPDEARLRAAWEAQWGALAVVGESRVRAVVEQAAAELVTALDAPAPTAVTVTALELLARPRSEPAGRWRQGDAGTPAGERGSVQRAVGRLAGAPVGRLVTTPAGDMSLADLLLLQLLRAASSAVESGGAALDGAAARLVTRLLADALAAKAPGKSVEVRITDAPLRVGVAVQCMAGPRHTRGTPPNVVEVLSAAVWIRLATGGLAWAAAVAGGEVRASGERADLTALLPLTG